MMTAPLKLGAFAALLAAVFAAAALAGSAIDPAVSATEPHMDDEAMSADPHGEPAESGASASATPTPGLAVADGGYRLLPASTELPAGRRVTYSFAIVDGRGRVVEEFEREHERRMHLIVVGRDFTGFQHLHPRRLEDGSWSTELAIARAGAYRVFADFSTERGSQTLASDLFVPGELDPVPLPAPATSADAGDGYEVTLAAEPAPAGGSGTVRFSVSRGGRELDSVEPYLGADGHLVALREHDQAFLHTHPQGEPGGSGPIAFDVEYPSAGRYRLYLQFKHDGEVRTAEFTQAATAAVTDATSAEPSPGHAEEEDHR